MLDLVSLLYQALSTQYGIVVETDNPRILRGRLYAERAKLLDPDLEVLQFHQSRLKPETEVWILKGASREKGAPTHPPLSGGLGQASGTL